MRWDLVPLAAFLLEEGYSDSRADAIVDAVAGGATLDALAGSHELGLIDLAGAEAALRRGRRRRSKAGRVVASIGDVLNVVVGSLRASGVEPCPGTLDERGFDVTIAGRPLRIAFVPPVAGGGPEEASPPTIPMDDAELLEAWDREVDADYGHYLDSLTDEQVDALAAEERHYRAAEELVLPPIAGGAPVPDADGSIHEAHQVEVVRDWYRRHPLSEFNAVRPD